MSKAPKKTKDDELRELGQKLQDFYELGYINRKTALLFSFLKGLAGGAGAFIGGTLVIAILLWVLSLFDQVPLIGRFFEGLQNTLQK